MNASLQNLVLNHKKYMLLFLIMTSAAFLFGCDYNLAPKNEMPAITTMDYKLKCYSLMDQEKARNENNHMGEFQLEWVKYSKKKNSCISKWFFTNDGKDFSFQRQDYYDVLTGEHIQTFPNMEEDVRDVKANIKKTDYDKLIRDSDSFDLSLDLVN